MQRKQSQERVQTKPNVQLANQLKARLFDKGNCHLM